MAGPEEWVDEPAGDEWVDEPADPIAARDAFRAEYAKNPNALSDRLQGALDATSLETKPVLDDDALRVVFEQSLRAAPDRHAGVLKLAKETRAPTDVIERNYDKLQDTWTAANFDPKAWREANPEVAKQLLERPELGRLVFRDQQLSVISKLKNLSLDIEGLMGERLGLDKVRDAIGFNPFASPLDASGLAYDKVKEFVSGTPAATAEEEREGKRVVAGKAPFVKDARTERLADAEAQEGPLARLGVPIARFIETKEQLEISKMQFELLTARAMGQSTFDLEKRILDAQRTAVQRDYNEGPLEQVLTDIAQAAASQVAIYKDAGIGAAAGAVVGGTAGAVATKSPAGVRAGALKGASIGGKAGMAYGSLRLEAGSAYGELLNAKTDDGLPLSEEEARGAALLYGGLAAIVELASERQKLKALGPLGSALLAGEKKAAVAELTKNMARPGFKAIVLSTARAQATAAGGEGGEEFIQDALQQLTTYLAKSKSQGEFQAGPVVDVEQSLLAGQKGYIGALGMAAPSFGVNVATHVIAQDKARIAGAQVQSLAGLANSPTVKAAPEAVARMITEATSKGGDPVTHLYVDPQAFVRLFQDEKADPGAAAAELMGPDGPRVLQEALASGGKLEVPVAQYLEKWGGSELAAKLAEDTTTRAEHPTARQLKDIEPRAKALAAEYEKNPPPATDAEAAFVASLEAELAATGKADPKGAQANINLWRALVRTQAEVFGVHPDDLFGDLAVSIQKGDDAATAPAGALAQDPKDLTPTQQAIAEKLRGMSDEDAAKAHYLDPVTGARDARAFDQLPMPAGKAVAVITLPAAKGVNDHPTAGGHNVTNDMLRQAAGPLVALHPEAARGGTNFRIYVDIGKEKEQLAAAITAVKAGMGNPGLDVIGAVGPDSELAFKQLRSETDRRRALPASDPEHIPAKGKLRPEVNVAALKFTKELAKGALPTELLQAIERRSEEQHFSESQLDTIHFTDEDGQRRPVKTGLLSAEGMRNAPQKANTLAFDLQGLGSMPKDVGDRVLIAFAQKMSELAGFEFIAGHLSGDEFEVRHDHPVLLERFANTLKGLLDAEPVIIENPATGETAAVSVRFRYGVGKDYDSADRAINAKRIAEAGAGAQASRDVGAGVLLPTGEQGLEGRGDRDQGQLEVSDPGRDPGRAEQEALALAKQANEYRAIAHAFKKSAKNRPTAIAWLQYCWQHRGPDGELLQPKAPSIDQKLVREFAKFGVVDPASFDLNKADDLGAARVDKDLQRGRKNGDEPDALRKDRMDRLGVAGDLTGIGKKRHHQENDATGPRGYTDIARTSLRRVFKVALNKNADLSTFLHESGHVFLELFADLAAREDAPERVREDWSTALKWMGVGDRSEIKREHHEKWARTFEAYLMTGKAPSAALVGAFERFRLWLKNVYRMITSLNAQLSPEIAGVFDRLLATDDEIQRTKRRMGLQPIWSSPAQAGLTPEQWQQYLADQEQATSHAARAADLRAMKDKLRETEGWWKEELGKHRDQAELEYETLPARKADLFLKGHGLVAPGKTQKLTKPTELDRKAVAAAVGEAGAKRFATVAKGGINPDDLADLFGYPTGAALLEAVVKLPAKDAWASEQAAARMAEKHPDVLADRAQLRELVAKGLHGDYTARWLIAEWNGLKAKAREPGSWNFSSHIDAVKRAAKLIVDRRLVSKLTPGTALRQERAAADSSARAAAKGDFAQAANFKQQQLLNMFLHRELTEARDERDAFLELASKLAKDKARARLGKAGKVYRGGVDFILESLQLKEPDPEAVLPSIAEVVGALEGDGATVMFDVEAVEQLLASTGDWKTLTVEQLRLVHDALKNIAGAARAKATVIIDGKRADKEEVVAELIADAQKNLPSLGPIASSVSAETAWQKTTGFFSMLDGNLLKPEVVLRGMLGGGNLKSPWFRALVKPLQDAKAREADLLKETIKPILEAFEKMPAAVRSSFMDKVDGAKLFPEHAVDLAQSLTAPTRRFELLMIALNSGNDSNLQRLLGGRNITAQQLAAAIDQLTKEELDWVQAVWDACESLKGPAFDLEERDSGLRPEAIAARPLRTRHGTYRGGYFPAIYDRRVEAVGERQTAQSIAGLMDPSFTRAGTPHSHLKGRAEQFAGALSLEPSSITRHLSQVAHDIAFREAVKSVGGLVLDPAIQATLKDRVGDQRAKQFLQWVKDVGQMRGVEGFTHSGALLGLARKLRANTVIAALGYAVPNAIEDLSNLVAAVPRTELKAKHLAAGLAEFMASPMRSLKEATAKSGELRTRHDQVQRELAKQVKSLTSTGLLSRGPVAWMKDHAFFFMEFSDKATSTPIWMGAYRQALAEGKSEADAVTFADVVVRQVFPSHSPVDAAPILRDKGFIGTSLMFYGFLSTYYNGIRELLHPLHTAEDGVELAKRVPRVGGRLLGYMLAVSVLSEFLRGRGREDDEDWAQWFLRKSLAGWLSAVPFGGDFSNAIEGGLLGKQTNPRVTSIATTGIALGKAALELGDEGKEGDKKLEDLIRAIAPVIGIPASQPLRTGKYLRAVSEGELEPRNPADVAGGLIYGERDGQPANPARLVGDAVNGE